MSVRSITYSMTYTPEQLWAQLLQWNICVLEGFINNCWRKTVAHKHRFVTFFSVYVVEGSSLICFTWHFLLTLEMCLPLLKEGHSGFELFETKKKNPLGWNSNWRLSPLTVPCSIAQGVFVVGLVCHCGMMLQFNLRLIDTIRCHEKVTVRVPVLGEERNNSVACLEN